MHLQLRETMQSITVGDHIICLCVELVFAFHLLLTFNVL